jgi:hypothetical protein
VGRNIFRRFFIDLDYGSAQKSGAIAPVESGENQV